MVSFLQCFLGSTSRNYLDLEKYLKKGNLNKNRKECVRNEKTNFIVVFWLLLSLIAFIVFVLNFASLWQDIAYWIVPSKDLYMDKPEIIRDLIKIVPMIILDCSNDYFRNRSFCHWY